MYIFAFLVALRLYKDAQLLPLLYLNIILTYDRWTLAEGMPVIGKRADGNGTKLLTVMEGRG